MEDFKNNKELFEDPVSYLLEYYPEALKISPKGRIRLKKEYRGISDIFSALSEGKINLGFIHSKKYWKENPNVQVKEIWAQCGAIYYKNNPEVIQMLTELFPFGSERINIKIERLVKEICGKGK